MSLLDSGCQCHSCLENTKRELEKAKALWGEGFREITFKPWEYRCSDDCCYEYGTHVFVNGFKLNYDGDCIDGVLIELMEFLEIDNVKIKYKNEEDID